MEWWLPGAGVVVVEWGLRFQFSRMDGSSDQLCNIVPTVHKAVMCAQEFVERLDLTFSVLTPQ